MKREGAPPRPVDHPLEGVLDRLLARERGEVRPPRRETAPGWAPCAAEGSEPGGAPHALRRMLVIAALGAEEGRAALRAAARWGLSEGRRPAALELGCASPAPEGEAREARGDPMEPDAHRLPLACVPCGPERLGLEPPEIVAGLLERLRRHESASDLLLVRIPPRSRALLMQAAFLAGGLILPLDDSDAVLHEAFGLSREVAETFVDLALWPFSERPRAVERYLAMMQEFQGVRPRALDAELAEGSAFLDKLPGAPEEGFLPALLTSDPSPPPGQLLQTGFLRL